MSLKSTDILVENWRGGFRHSAGRLGSHYLKTLREEARFLGWKTGTPARVLVPPKDLGGDGEWVEVGPGAVLLSTLTPASTNDQAPQLVLARLRLDGADSVMFARVNIEAQSQNLQPGTRLVAQFEPADEKGGREFWFEPRRGL